MSATTQPAGTGSRTLADSAWRRLADRIAAADPAYSRLRMASRALLSLVMTAVALVAISRLHSQPPAVYGLAAIGSFVGSVAVRDTGWRAQAVTRCLAVLAMTGVAFLGSLASPYPRVAEIGFLAVVFASVYIRRYGPRWTAVGMVAFMAYFMADYLRAQPAQIGWILFAAGLGLTAAQISCCVLMPDDPERDFRRAMGTLDHRVTRILQHLLDAAAAGALPRQDRRMMRRQAMQLRSIVLMAEGFIPDISGTGDNGPGQGAALATALFDLQIAVERLIRARHDNLPTAAALRRQVQDYAAETDPRAPPATPGRAEPRDFPGLLLERILQTRGRIRQLLGDGPSALFAGQPGRAAAAPPPPAAPTGRFAVPQPLRRPIQITVACGLAMAVGISVSGSRWYWAVLTAFIVFNNTRTRADTAIRALQRSAGTLAGIVAGAVAAVLLRNQPAVAISLIPVLFFLAIYFLQASYGVMIFFVTIALALLYGLMGSFTPELLELRLLETLVGGAAGMAAAFFIFPVHTAGEGGRAFEGFLTAFRDALEGVRRHTAGAASDEELIALSRQFDRRYREMANTVRPIGGPWAVVTRFGHVREQLLLLLACTHWLRDLCSVLTGRGDGGPRDDERLAALIDRVEGRIELARGQSARWFEVSRGPDLSGAPMVPPTVPTDPGRDKPLVALTALDLLLTRALISVGIDPRP